MKKTILTFAVMALVLTFTSCKENAAETTEETSVELLESPEEAAIQAVEATTEEVDTISANDTIVEDTTNTTPVE